MGALQAENKIQATDLQKIQEELIQTKAESKKLLAEVHLQANKVTTIEAHQHELDTQLKEVRDQLDVETQGKNKESEKNNVLQQQFKQLQKEKEQQIGQLQEQAKLLETKKKVRAQEVTSIKAQLDATQKQEHELKAQLANVQIKATKAEDSNQILNTKNAQLAEQLQQIKDISAGQADSLKKAEDELRRATLESAGNLEKVKEEAEKQKAVLREEIKAMKKQKEQVTQEIAEIRTHKAEEISRVNEELSKAKEKEEQESARSKEFENRLEQLQKEQKELNSDLVTAKKDFDFVKHSFENLKKEQEEAFRQSQETSERRLKELAKQLEAVNKEKDEANNKVTILAKDVAVAASEKETQQQEFASQIKRLTNEKNEKIKEVESAETKLNTQQLHQEGLNKQLLTMQGKVAAANGENVELNEDLRLLQQQLLILNEEKLAQITDLQKSQGELKNIIEELTTAKSTLKDQLTTRSKFAEITTQTDSTDELLAQQQIKLLKQENIILINKLAEVEKFSQQNNVQPPIGNDIKDKGKSAVYGFTNANVSKQPVATLENETQSTDKFMIPSMCAPLTNTPLTDKDADEVLQAFKDFSIQQSKAIAEKLNMPKGNDLQEYAQRNIKELSKTLNNSELLQELVTTETKEYASIHKKFQNKFKKISWDQSVDNNKFILGQHGQEIAKLQIEKSDSNVSKHQTAEGKTIENARNIKVPLCLEKNNKTSCHISLALQDENGQKVPIYLTAHYKDDKLVHLTRPIGTFSCSDKLDSPLYIKKDGKIYTLPVNKGMLEELEKEVLKNKGKYFGVVINQRTKDVQLSPAEGKQNATLAITDESKLAEASKILQSNQQKTSPLSLVVR